MSAYDEAINGATIELNEAAQHLETINAHVQEIRPAVEAAEHQLQAEGQQITTHIQQLKARIEQARSEHTAFIASVKASLDQLQQRIEAGKTDIHQDTDACHQALVALGTQADECSQKVTQQSDAAEQIITAFKMESESNGTEIEEASGKAETSIAKELTPIFDRHREKLKTEAHQLIEHINEKVIRQVHERAQKFADHLKQVVGKIKEKSDHLETDLSKQATEAAENIARNQSEEVTSILHDTEDMVHKAEEACRQVEQLVDNVLTIKHTFAEVSEAMNSPLQTALDVCKEIEELADNVG